MVPYDSYYIPSRYPLLRGYPRHFRAILGNPPSACMLTRSFNTHLNKLTVTKSQFHLIISTDMNCLACSLPKRRSSANSMPNSSLTSWPVLYLYIKYAR